MIISRTPFRVSFFGGGTDYPAWYREHGGAVLATTINKYCYITARWLPPFFEHRSRIVWSQIEHVKSHAKIQHPAVREVLNFLQISRGVEVHHDGDLPARTGLGSSSSFTVGLLHALYGLNGVMPSKAQLAYDAIHVEQQRLREAVGCQDQVLAAYGGLNHVEFESSGNIRATPIRMQRQRLTDLEEHLMLVFTGLSRTASEIAGEQLRAIPRRRKELETMRQMVEHAMNLLQGQGDMAAFGRLLHEGWQLKRRLSAKITTPVIDTMYERARRAGAFGGKLLGAGGGGFLLLCVPPERRANVRRALGRFLHVPIRFETSGSQILFYDPDSAAQADAGRDGADRANSSRMKDGEPWQRRSRKPLQTTSVS